MVFGFGVCFFVGFHSSLSPFSKLSWVLVPREPPTTQFWIVLDQQEGFLWQQFHVGCDGQQHYIFKFPALISCSHLYKRSGRLRTHPKRELEFRYAPFKLILTKPHDVLPNPGGFYNVCVPKHLKLHQRHPGSGAATKWFSEFHIFVQFIYVQSVALPVLTSRFHLEKCDLKMHQR